jgi:DNA-binding transcriptional MerR regulator
MGGSSVEILRDRYTITELSQSLKITDHALRYYEKEFNIKIPKDERGRRY